MTQEQKTYAEIRKHPRLNKKIKGDNRPILPDERKERHPLETETISGGGLMFISTQPMQEGAHFEFRLFLKDGPVQFTAQVVWTKEQPDPKKGELVYPTGFRFIVITQEDIAKLLMS
jgi:PilZ domain-containing protein